MEFFDEKVPDYVEAVYNALESPPCACDELEDVDIAFDAYSERYNKYWEALSERQRQRLLDRELECYQLGEEFDPIRYAKRLLDRDCLRPKKRSLEERTESKSNRRKIETSDDKIIMALSKALGSLKLKSVTFSGVIKFADDSDSE